MPGMLADGSGARGGFKVDEPREELDAPPLGPRLDAPRPAALQERRVAPAPDELRPYRGRQVGRIGQSLGRDDRIVERVDEQSRPLDAAKIRGAGGARPVVALVL